MSPPVLRQAVVERVVPLDDHLVEVTCRADGPLTWEAGQWLSFKVADGGPRGKGIWRVYSLSSASHESAAPGNGSNGDAAHFRTLVEIEADGPGGKRFASLHEGDRLTWHGPYGKFVLRPRPAGRIVLAADGVGIGPVRAMIMSLARTGVPPIPVTLVQQAALHGAVPYESEFAALAAQTGGALRYVVTRPDGSPPAERRPLPDLVPSLFPAPAVEATDWYLCGSGRCTDPLKGWLKASGVAPAAIRVERFFD